MEPKKAARIPAALGRKLFRVLVMGGAVLAASCASVPKGGSGDGSKPAESDASRSGKNEPTKESGGGVPGW